MNRFCLSIIVIVGLSFFANPAFAQSPAAKPKTPLNSAASGDKAGAKAEADRIAKERRVQQARSLLISLAGEAYSFRDQTLRARSMARIADALWGVEAEQGRALFRKAWEAAEASDQESHEPLNLGQEPPNLRKEVLTLAAKRDPLLAEEFLQKLKAGQQESKAEPSANNLPSGNNLWRLTEASEHRLSLAEEMLRTGDIKRALQLAGPVLDNVTISTLDFLTELREKDPVAADQRYAVMLENTGGNLLADANTISLLSSYLFTPHMYVIFHDGGTDTSSMSSSFPQANVDPQLRLAFFQTASSVLQRFQLSPGQGQSTAGIVGNYMVIKRLMPLFEQYAPRELTAVMRSQFEVLDSMVSDGVRQSENEWIRKGISPEKPLADQELPLLDQIGRARTSDERDEIYFKTDGVQDFDVEGIFGKLATDDYDRAVQLARGFQGEAPRTNATIAIALAVLNEKNASAPALHPTLKN